MNDFTKEELEIIWSSLSKTANEVKWIKGGCESIMDKIQSMIEKLPCVHHSDELLAYGYKYTCIHCGELFQ